MKYIIGLIVIAGLALGTYWMLQPRPDCGAIVTTTNECLEPVSTIDCSKNVYSLEVCPDPILEVEPSDYQAPNYNPQQTENGSKLWQTR